jgi:hypothetical protein
MEMGGVNMKDYQKAFKFASDVITVYYDHHEKNQAQALKNIEPLKELVNKATPKKLNGMINDWACANCDSDRGIIEEKPYCAVCGQKLDWSKND